VTKNHFRKALLTAMLTLLVASAAGCVVPYRDHYYDRYRRYDGYHRYDPDFRYERRGDRYRWYRD
jgi:hypothetical protein